MCIHADESKRTKANEPTCLFIGKSLSHMVIDEYDGAQILQITFGPLMMIV